MTERAHLLSWLLELLGWRAWMFSTFTGVALAISAHLVHVPWPVVLAIGVGVFAAMAVLTRFVIFFWDRRSVAATGNAAQLGQGGSGGRAEVAGRHSGAEGGDGGQGGIGPGGAGGDAVVTGDHSFARGGDGGNAGTADGRGGPRSMSAGEQLNLPTQLWPFGYGVVGANHPEYNRRLAVLTRIREEYIRTFPCDAVFIHAGVDTVPVRWVNKRLEELGEPWRVQGLREGGYMMPPLGSQMASAVHQVK
jgi:hypothetical protein